MATSKITINLTPTKKVELTSDTPDIAALVDAIVKNKDVIDVEAISVDCDSDTFDKASFTQVITDSAKKFIAAIQLEKDTFDSVMAELKAEEQKA